MSPSPGASAFCSQAAIMSAARSSPGRTIGISGTGASVITIDARLSSASATLDCRPYPDRIESLRLHSQSAPGRAAVRSLKRKQEGAVVGVILYGQTNYDIACARFRWERRERL